MRITKSRLYVFKLLINVAFEDETTVKNGGVRGRGLILVKNHPLPPPYARRGKVPILGEAFIELFRFIMSYFPLLFEEGNLRGGVKALRYCTSSPPFLNK